MYKGLTVAVLITGVMLFSGCSSKKINIIKDESTTRLIHIPAKSSLTNAGAINSSNRMLIQVAAEETISSGFSHFKFNKPDLFISGEKYQKHIYLKDINSTEDFLEKCSNSNELASLAIQTLTSRGIASNFVFDPCDFFVMPKMFNLDVGYSAGWIIMSNNENDISAKEVIDNLKKLGFYKESDKDYNNAESITFLSTVGYSLHKRDGVNKEKDVARMKAIGLTIDYEY